MAFVSPTFNLPQFQLAPCFDADSPLNGPEFLRSFIKYKHQVHFSGLVSFNNYYDLYLPDASGEQACHLLFGSRVFDLLLEARFHDSVFAWGDTLALPFMDIDRELSSIDFQNNLNMLKSIADSFKEQPQASTSLKISSLNVDSIENIKAQSESPIKMHRLLKYAKVLPLIVIVAMVGSTAYNIVNTGLDNTTQVLTPTENTSSLEPKVRHRSEKAPAPMTKTQELDKTRLHLPKLSGFSCQQVENYMECIEPITGIVLVSIPGHLSTSCGAKAEYWAGKYEVTQGQWEALMDYNPSFFNSTLVGEAYKNHPVEQVSWQDTQQFLAVLNSRYQNVKFSLPIFGQFEIACLGGHRTDWPFGYGDDDKLDAFAFHQGNSNGMTHPVGQKSANLFGLYDVLGNVGEWGKDAFVRVKFVDGEMIPGPVEGKEIFGGSWDEDKGRQSCRQKTALEPFEKSKHVGFRVIATPYISK